MVWVGIAAALGLSALLTSVVMVRHRKQSADSSLDDVDPLFAAGIALSGAGVALATTIGSEMFAVMIVGLLMMAVGVNRTRNRER